MTPSRARSLERALAGARRNEVRRDQLQLARRHVERVRQALEHRAARTLPSESLCRIVTDHARGRPPILHRTGQQIVHESARLQRVHVCNRRRPLDHLLRGGGDLAHRRSSRATEDGFGGLRRLALPVTLEIARHLSDHRPDRHHVQVDERERLVGVEVLIADVATADDRDLAVDRERLVVHAAIEPRKVGKVFERPPAAQAERIEQPDLDVRVRGERRKERVEARGIVVVQQQADAHAAIGRPAHRREEQRT